MFLLFLGIALLSLGPGAPPGHRVKDEPGWQQCIDAALSDDENSFWTEIVGPSALSVTQESPAIVPFQSVKMDDNSPVETTWSIGGGSALATAAIPTRAASSLRLTVNATPWTKEDWNRLYGVSLQGTMELHASPTDDRFLSDFHFIQVAKLAPSPPPELLTDGIHVKLPPGGSCDRYEVNWFHRDYVEIDFQSEATDIVLTLISEEGAAPPDYAITKLKGLTTRCYMTPTLTLWIKASTGEVVQKPAKKIYIEVPCPPS